MTFRRWAFIMQDVTIDSNDALKNLQSILYKKRGRSRIIIMSAKSGCFGMADAKYHAVVSKMLCIGKWAGAAEVDGSQFMKVLEILKDRDVIRVSKEDYFVVIKAGTTVINLKRLDPPGAKKTKKKPLPHKGKVEHPPAPKTKRAEFSDTWCFSARVPLPASAYEDRFDDRE
jgi:hypothetical protein